jgi:hypothetical protein
VAKLRKKKQVVDNIANGRIVKLGLQNLGTNSNGLVSSISLRKNRRKHSLVKDRLPTKRQIVIYAIIPATGKINVLYEIKPSPNTS